MKRGSRELPHFLEIFVTNDQAPEHEHVTDVLAVLDETDGARLARAMEKEEGVRQVLLVELHKRTPASRTVIVPLLMRAL